MRTGLMGVLAMVTSLNVGVAQVPAGPAQPLGMTATPVPMERLFLGGVAGLGAAILGTHLAYQAGGGGRLCGDDSCGLAAGVTALLLLEPILVPAGVHLANHRRGSFAGTFFGSLLSGAAVLYLGNKFDLGVEFVYVGAAIQIAASAIMERAGERERQRK